MTTKHAKTLPSKRRPPKALRFSLPATSANLGPAFDAAAIALDLYIKIHATPASAFSITATGRDKAICQEIENNLIFDTYRDVMQSHGATPTPLSLRIQNDIPIGKGCGSSAAARLAGIALANHFGRLGWKAPHIIEEASRREHHADNASACWLGGLTVAAMPENGEIRFACIRPKGKWPLLLAIPDEPLSTEEARRVLPGQYSRTDTVANIQNSMLLLAAFTKGRRDLLKTALDDHIHQPYRAALCPLLPCLSELCGVPGILGMALSGAGPSVIVFLNPKTSAKKTRRLVATHLAKSKLKAELLLTSITLHGLRS